MKYLPAIVAAMSLGVAHAQQPAANEAKPVEKIKDVKVTEPSVVALAPSISKEAAGIISEYKTKRAAVYKLMNGVNDWNEREKIYKNMPHAGIYAQRLFLLIDKDVKAKGVESALLWIAGSGSQAQRDRAGKLLLSEYVDSPNLAKYVRTLSGSYPLEVTPALRSVAIGAGDRRVRVAAHFAIAQKLLKGLNNVGFSEERKKLNRTQALSILSSIKRLPNIEKTDPRLLRSIQSMMYKLENLSIGCVAPDIIAKDEAGKEFKLSDYRGKVVLLDFWGYW